MTKNGEERCKNQSWLRFGSASTSFFLLISPFLFDFSQSFTSGPQNIPLSSSSRLFIAKQSIWGHDSSPRRVGYFTMKLFGGPGELEASLGEPGVKKSVKMTLWPSFLSIFCILFWNVEKPFGLRDNWCQAS